MSHRKDLLIVIAVLAVAAVLFGVSRLMPDQSVEGRTADVTLAPDAIEYLDTPEPEKTEQPAAEESAAPAETEAPAETAKAETETPVPAAALGTDEPQAEPVEGTPEPDAAVETDKPVAQAETAVPETEKAQETVEPETQTVETTAEPRATAEPAVAAAGPVFGPSLAEPDEPVRGYVVITVAGRQYGDPIPMDREKIITIRQDAHTVNRIHITRDSVYMENSTCENQDCVGEGEVTLENYRTRILGTYIICLPNSVTVEMIPADNGTEAAE